jgi:DNA-binding NarL/FixJ family response regulator
MSLRLLLADDQAMVRAGLRLVCEAEPDLQVVGEAGDGEQAVAAARRLRPDVTLMDVRMPGVDGIEATRRLSALEVPVTRVLVLTTFDTESYVHAALRAGAAGFLLKDAEPERLVEAVRVVAAGDALLSPAVTRTVIAELVRRPATSPPPEYARLTDREREILLEVAAGHSNAEIAARLYVNEATVKTHVARVLDKLSLRDRVQAVVFAYEAGLVVPGR